MVLGLPAAAARAAEPRELREAALLVVRRSLASRGRGRHLKFREKAFVALAWLPKATVQAALASGFHELRPVLSHSKSS